MKKSRMLLLFGGLLLMLVGYLAWCGRTFYLNPPMPDLSRVPIEARELARAGIQESSLFRPERLSFNRLGEVLANPYESEPLPIRAEWEPGNIFFIKRSGAPQRLVLMRIRKRWTLWFLPRDTEAMLHQMVTTDLAAP